MRDVVLYLYQAIVAAVVLMAVAMVGFFLTLDDQYFGPVWMFSMALVAGCFVRVINIMWLVLNYDHAHDRSGKRA